MFRIECFVTDKHLPDVLRSLGQRVMNLSVQPVVDAAVEKKGRAKEVKPGPGAGEPNLERMIRALRKSGRVINRGSIELACQEIGLRSESAPYLMKKAREAGYIKAKGRGPTVTYTWGQHTNGSKE